MKTVIDQTEAALASHLYYIALFTALAIPDIAASLESQDGRATGKRYASWYEKWVRPRLRETRNRDNPFTGGMCYGFRCGMLHQGSSQNKNHPYSHIAFVEPGYPNLSVHYCTVSGKVLVIQLDAFVGEVLQGARLWLQAVEGTKPFDDNYVNFARRHPQGLAPYLVGPPVVG
jgi:hypothetical protein